MSNIKAEQSWDMAMEAMPSGAMAAAQALKKSCAMMKEEDRLKVAQALQMARLSHEGQWRMSGEPYVEHPIQVATLARSLGLDADAICAALLHDVMEDCSVSAEAIAQRFGGKVAEMVEALTKIDELRMPSGIEGESVEAKGKAATLRKMMLAMSRDMRVILIKLCDRSHNMRTIEAMPKEKQRRIARETQEIYAPIASRLGLNMMWNELMDRSFQTLHPWRARVMKARMEMRYAHCKNYVESAVKKAQEALERAGIEAQVSGRKKSARSVYMKMKEKKLRFEEINDREAIRVIVKNKAECYMALGVLHELWKPVPGFFKDYIAIPKINGYQSLHTALLNEMGNPMEAQVRTEQMHRWAEDGIASHWLYKEEKQGESDSKEAWVWLQSLLDIQASGGHAEDFLEHVKTDLFSDEVYVFTPAGEVVTLPRGASALDFAFAIHSDVGMKASKVMVNNEPSDLSRKLRSGDRVSVVTNPKVIPSAMWLSMLKTGRAKAQVRAFLRAQQSAQNIITGERLVEQALAKLGVSIKAIDSSKGWEKVKKATGMEKQDALERVACGQMDPLSMAKTLARGAHSKEEAEQKRPVLVSGEESDFVCMARCCAPLPPQPIAGILSPNKGLAVHRSDCEVYRRQMTKSAMVDVEWEPMALERSFGAQVKIKAKNERGALGRIAALIAAQGADVNNVRVSGNGIGEDRALIDVEIQVKSKFHLDQVIDALKHDKAVVNVF